METAETAREILDVDLVSASHLQTLLPADLLSQHIVHGNIQDIINSQSQDYDGHTRLDGQYLSDPYEAQDLLSNTELTEEESKLAAAFVAVQLVHQHKQQCIQEGVIVNAKNDVVTSLSHLTNSGHSSVIENLNNGHSLTTDEIPTDYVPQELMENDLTDAGVKLFNSITNGRLPPLKKFPQNKRSYPLTRFNIINNHELNDSHIISNIISNGTQNINLQNNIQSLRPTFINDINTNTIDLGNKLLLHNNSVDLTLQNNGIGAGLLDRNINDSNIITSTANNIVGNGHVHIVNGNNVLNGGAVKSMKTNGGLRISGNTIITNINGTIVKEELDFDAKNIKCDEEDVNVLNDHLTALGNSRYAVSDSDCSDVPTKRTRTSHNNQQNFGAPASTNAASSSRSLPHKKRISKRLKSNIKPKANSNAKSQNVTFGSNGTSNNSSEGSTRAGRKPAGNSKNSSNAFSCQLCGSRFEIQMEFYKHLKLHYEPPEEEQQQNQTHYIQLNNIVNNEQLDSPLLRAHLTEPHTILPNLDDDSLSSGVQNSNEIQTHNENTIMQNQHNINLDSLPNLVISNMSGLRCKFCPLIFKRSSALEGHIRDAHFKDDIQDEFSEPEDLMEGIRSVVEANGQCFDDDVEDIKITLMEADKNQRDWYQADELHATEVDLQEIEAEQNNQRQNQQNHHPHPHPHNQQQDTTSNHHEQAIADTSFCENSSEFEIREIEEDDEQEFEEQQVTSSSRRRKKPDNNDRKCSFVCPLCADSFDSREQYNEHEAECQLLLCDSDSELSDKKGLEKFMGPKLNCLQCDRQFNHRNSLMYHIQSHSEKRPYQCEICGNSFFATSALKVHMRRHSGDKPYQCRICLRHFRQWSDLKYHMVSIHSDIRQYQCEFCGKDFARKYSLILHRRIHTGEKNYKCEFCNKTFRASSYLQNHRRIHTGEKPYPCEICGKPFRVRGDMKRHMSTHTRERSANGNCNGQTSKTVTKKEDLKIENKETNGDAAQDSKIDLNTNGLSTKSSESSTNNKMQQQFTMDDSDSSGSKLHNMKMEIIDSTNTKYIDANQLQDQSLESTLTNERLCSPSLEIDLKSAQNNKGCSLELQVQVSANSDPQLHSTSNTNCDQTSLGRFTKNLDSSTTPGVSTGAGGATTGGDSSTVYLWPVYMT
ncbi:uncharacterized protein LOC113372790 [Ctenocephalides felis]|uniref:uncharacterized protein LOC113372790 n=1 Tax=Ctenocephalides felis TaxID=7515 RepID=UPI000E6E4453|nr:uncharacterized protein LOC113372790 [Ctenocephalides felis]XP_026468917.1 uncharacterized protein LOC113372790 [Ctenocephalides felis]